MSDNEKRETHAAVIAEYREDADKMDACALYQPTTEYVRKLLNRLEAAHRREITTLNLGVSSAHDALREVIEQNCSHCHKRELAAGGNAAAAREALRRLRDATRNFYNQILNSEYSKILDKYTCVKQGFPAVLDVRAAIPLANAVLAEGREGGSDGSH